MLETVVLEKEDMGAVAEERFVRDWPAWLRWPARQKCSSREWRRAYSPSNSPSLPRPRNSCGSRRRRR